MNSLFYVFFCVTAQSALEIWKKSVPNLKTPSPWKQQSLFFICLIIHSNLVFLYVYWLSKLLVAEEALLAQRYIFLMLLGFSLKSLDTLGLHSNNLINSLHECKAKNIPPPKKLVKHMLMPCLISSWIAVVHTSCEMCKRETSRGCKNLRRKKLNRSFDTGKNLTAVI